jgi:hypothetical protein
VLRKATGELVKRLLSLGRRLSINQIGYRLGLGQIHALVLKGAAGKFTRLRHPQAQPIEPIENALNHRHAAMEMKLGGILARIAGRTGEPQY